MSNLTPEERRKIYEEEKSRIEGKPLFQGKAFNSVDDEADKKPKISTTTGESIRANNPTNQVHQNEGFSLSGVINSVLSLVLLFYLYFYVVKPIIYPDTKSNTTAQSEYYADKFHPDLVITERGWNDEGPVLKYEGVVENRSDEPFEHVRVSVNFLGKDRKTVISSFGDMSSNLPARGKWKFQILAPRQEEVGSVQITEVTGY